MGRAPCCDKDSVKKGPWSPEEDAKLKAFIEEHGTGGNWIALPHKIGLKRCGKSCRLRWLNYLRPNIKHGGFSEEEDHIICSLYISIGSRWSIIAAQLPGRTDNDVKNYWNTKLKKKLLGRRRGSQARLLNHDSNKVNGAIGEMALSALSTSTLERMQLHMKFQSLQYPFPMCPKFMIPQTPKTLEGSNLTSCDLMQEKLRNSLNEFAENSDFNSTTDSPVQSITPKLNCVEESNTNFNMIDSLQAELRELIEGKTGCFIGQEDHIREFDCFKEMDGAKESMIWWATEPTDFATESSSNSWDSGAILQSQGTFQNYVMGYSDL